MIKNLPSGPFKLPGQTARLIWGSFVLALLILFGVCFALLSQLGVGYAENSSRILGNQGVLRVNYVASEMRMINDRLKQVARLFAAEAEQLDLQALARQGVIDQEVFEAVQIIDAQGKVLLSSAQAQQQIDLSQTLAFKTHAAKNSTDMWIDKAAFARGAVPGFAGFSRRLNDPQGNFAGVVRATIKRQYFDRAFEDVHLLSNVSATLVGLDGTILTTLGGQTGSEHKDFKAHPYITQVSQGVTNGLYEGSFGPDGIKRRYLFHKVPGFDLVVMTSVNAKVWDMLSPRGKWVAYVSMVTVFAELFILVLIFRSHSLRLNRTLAQNRQLSDELRVSEERLRLAVVGSNLGTWDWDLERNMFTTNALFKEQFRSWPNETAGQTGVLKELVHPEDAASLIDAVQQHMHGATPYFSSECRICNPAGNWVWARVQGQVTEHSPAQRPIRMSGTVMDITEQKTAEARTKDHNEQLATIFSLNQDALVVFDHKRRVNFINPAFQQLTRIEPQSLLGLDEEQLTQQINKVCAPNQQFCGLPALRERRARTAVFTRELLVTQEPNSRVLMATLTPSNASTISLVLSLRDVTHETLVEKLKSEYLATAAHEIRSPMASILGFAELMTNTELNAGNTEEFSNIILSQAQRVKGILDELLDLARIEAGGGQDFVFEPVDLQVLVNRVVTDFLPPDGRPLPSVDIPSQHCRIDLAKASQALLNVLTNAYKYSDKNSPVSIRHVKPAVINNREMAGITVQDLGIGMNQENLKRVFERFYRINQNSAATGTGLGMAIVKEIMTFHEGDVVIKSIPGQGTAVTLLFPLFQG